MARHSTIIRSLVLLLSAAHAAGAQDSTTATPRASASREERSSAQPRTELALRAAGGLHDNFFQQPDAAPQEDIRSATAELRLLQAIGVSGRAQLRVRGGAAHYDKEVGTSPFGELAVVLRGQRQSLDLGASGSFDAPRFEVGDSYGRADVVGAGADYELRIVPALSMRLLADVARERYDDTPQKDNAFVEGGGALRWRGFGSVFSPEVGATFARRDVEVELENYDQRAIFLQLRSSPTPWVYLSARVRRRTRDYSTDVADASNFRREDTRDQVALSAQFTLRAGPSLDVYFAREDVESSRTERSFAASLLSLGVTVPLMNR